MSSAELPIDALLPAIKASLAGHPRLVLEAPPGAGKTTRVPLALLDAPWCAGQRILMLEPRRVAARAAASFMATLRGEPIGATVGYRIRFENRVGPNTRIEVVTEGIMTRMIQSDPTLDGVAALIFDEFHERHLHADLGLALALEAQADLRPELRILLMSATLDGAALAKFLDAPRLTSAGRGHAVAIAHFASRRAEPWEGQLRRCVEQSVIEHPGDVLVFLPGRREIDRGLGALAAVADKHRFNLLALHGELPIEQQTQALTPDSSGQRRVVLATNVAESSVTLPGVRVVVDSGLAREPRFDPGSGFSRLELTSIAQSSADQRAGRAGRVAEGWCYRLWPASQRLDPQRRAEILQVDLASLALELAAWGSAKLHFVDPPPPGHLAAAQNLLAHLGALEDGRLTPLGRELLGIGTHPRLAAMLARSEQEERALACDLIVLLEGRDPLRHVARDDLAARWRALAAFRAGRAESGANRGALAALDQQSRQWRHRVGIKSPPTSEVSAHTLGSLLSYAFPDRIAHQHASDARRYVLANGRSARLLDDSTLFGWPWLVAAELRFDERESLILRGAALDASRLERDFQEHFRTEDRVGWDRDRRAIFAVRERLFDRIVLEQKPLPAPDRTRYGEALVDAVRQFGLTALPWTEELSQWRERARCLRAWLGRESGLPDFDDPALLASLESWLQPALEGKSRLDALDEAALAQALKGRCDRAQQQRIEVLAPTRISVPSGLERRIEYRVGEHPVLAVKLQELFGLADTPRICEGRIALTLHLLSPGGRPLQVTQDLRGFWERTYPEVRKEMKGRYPRHPWPDDPWSATPTHRAKPRGT